MSQQIKILDETVVGLFGTAAFNPAAIVVVVWMTTWYYGLVWERRNSSANALELRLSWTNPLI